MFTCALPKWPALTVVGESVTPEQAAQIIVRTDRFSFHCNDREWNRLIWQATGIEPEKEEPVYFPDWETVRRARERFRVLDLYYLVNARIESSWIGGPHGWCDWDGQIGCNNYNIGKWPSVEDVLEDWRNIAAAFPFLTLKAQLWSGEKCEEGTVPLVEFSVQDGQAEVYEPVGPLDRPRDDLDEVALVNRFTSRWAERGCTIEKLRWALSLCDTEAGVT